MHEEVSYGPDVAVDDACSRSSVRLSMASGSFSLKPLKIKSTDPASVVGLRKLLGGETYGFWTQAGEVYFAATPMFLY